MKNYFKILIPSTLFLITILFVGVNLGKPFWGEHDWNGARYGNIARNYLRYGLITTKLGQVENGGVTSHSKFTYYTHYQPLLPLLIAGSYKIFGISEFATRLVPLLATGGLVIVIFLIGESLFSRAAGLYGAFFALATPMVRYFGKNPVHEPLATFFGALSFYGAILLKKKDKKGWPILLYGLVLTALTNWSFAFLILGLTFFLFDKKNLRKIVKLWILGGFLGFLHFLHIFLLTGSFFGGGLISAALLRTSVNQTSTSFGIVQYLGKARLWFSTLFTNTLMAASVAGIIFAFKRKDEKLLKLIGGMIVFSLYSIFFANASYIHSYFIYYFILPLSVSTAYLFFSLREKLYLIAILLLLLLFGFYERNSYLVALNTSEGDRPAVEAGRIIKSATKDGETVLVSPSEYAESRLPILSYYSQRNIVDQPKLDYDWVMNVGGDTINLSRK